MPELEAVASAQPLKVDGDQVVKWLEARRGVDLWHKDRKLLVTLTDAALARARSEALEECATIAEAMAYGEDVNTGRLKAVNIAAAIRSLAKQERR